MEENVDLSAFQASEADDAYQAGIDQAQEEVQAEDEEQELLAKAEADQGFLPDNPLQLATETASALIGGGADAVESVGGFVDLSGDTIKTGLNKLFGNPIDPTQNPFSNEYEANNPLDIPDHLIPENNSGLGKLARGLVEFGFLTAATGGVGGATFGGARAGLRVAATARAAGIGVKGVRRIKFVGKLTKIASEGAIADLVSTSSEAANIANLVEEHAPFIPFAEALAIDPEKDNRWIARLKTVAAGSGVNLVGHGLAAFVKGSWKAAKARRAGATVEEANMLGNKAYSDELARDLQLDEAVGTELAGENFLEGKGVSNANPRDDFLSRHLDKDELDAYNNPDTPLEEVAALDDIANDRGALANDPWDPDSGMSYFQTQRAMKGPDPLVNPRLGLDSEKSTYRPDSLNL